MSHELSVSIARRGAKVDLDMESAAFGVISIDGEQIPAEERPGTAKKLLASSALYCYCAALDKALETRSAKYRRIEGKATVRTGTDDKGRGRVTGIDLDVTVFMDQEAGLSDHGLARSGLPGEIQSESRMRRGLGGAPCPYA